MFHRNSLPLILWSTSLTFAVFSVPAQGQFFRGGGVGGVKIDPRGTVERIVAEDLQGQLALLRKEVEKPQEGMGQVELRLISLKRLQNAVADALQKEGRIPTDLMYLAGLQRLQYLFVYPDQQDIVIGGPAEPWMVRERDAAVVGVYSQLPPVHLEDLLVAFQTLLDPREGLSCSIEPTAEGQKRLSALLKNLPRGVQPGQVENRMKEAFGPQLVKLTGVSPDSQFAHVLVAADYQMKRLAMQLDQSPISGFPSYMEMAKNSRTSQGTPRWWMACNYEAIGRSDDRMAWSISGNGVKTLTETDLIHADGSRSGSGKVDAKAQQWADLMTKHYAELSEKYAVFGHLRNVMDLSVAATLVLGERLDQLAGCNLDLLVGKTDLLKTGGWEIPRQIPPHCSFVRGSNGWVVSASGGVQIDTGSVVQNQKKMELAKPAINAISTWWWNG